MKSIISFIFMLAVLFSCSTHISVDDALDEIAWEIADTLADEPQRIMGISHFYQDGKISPHSNSLINSLTSQLVEHFQWYELPHQVVSRQALDQLAQEMEFQLSSMADESSQVELGKLLGADLIITGIITYDQGLYVLNVQLIEVETGVIRKALEYDIWID